MTRFLRSVEALRLAEHEHQLATMPAVTLPAQPRERLRLAELPPLERQPFAQGKKTSPETIAAVVRESQVDGVTHDALAARYGCSVTTIGRLLKKAGAPLSKFSNRRTA